MGKEKKISIDLRQKIIDFIKLGNTALLQIS